jgi:hypothetical protein
MPHTKLHVYIYMMNEKCTSGFRVGSTLQYKKIVLSNMLSKLQLAAARRKCLKCVPGVLV